MCVCVSVSVCVCVCVVIKRIGFTAVGLPSYARMLTYADVCCDVLTYADVCHIYIADRVYGSGAALVCTCDYRQGHESGADKDLLGPVSGPGTMAYRFS